jgi:asparagine synthase (glutamine-hydrolysing)
MIAPMTCRGPDGSGTWVTRDAGLAHRRLIVIDPAGGTQPMARQDGNDLAIIVYNGELYNFQELRQELISLGYPFRSRSDTEVVLTAYQAWGVEALDRLNGIYAFAIWRPRDKTLFIARDRLGVKPVFWARTATGLVFASEIKGVLAHPDVTTEVGPDGLAEIFALGPARTPGHAIFRHVQELKPGHYLLLQPEQLRVRPYWQLSSHPHPDSLSQSVQTVRTLLEDAVSRQLVADVPVATLLSGGLDSSLVTAIAHKRFLERQAPLHTFSIEFTDMARHFEDNGFQTSLDTPWAQKMANWLNTEHHRIELDTPDLDRYLTPALIARDVPGHADVDTSLLVFSQAIKPWATVGLSGEAADEIFGGYPWFHRDDALNADTFPWSLRLKDRLSILSPECYEYLRPEAYVAERYQQALDEVPRLKGEPWLEARRREIAYLSITRFLPTLLERKDRMTMASSLEVRVPFCDHRLVEYVWNIPWALKNWNNQPKGLLRLAAEGWLPDEIRWRRKSPYPATVNPSYFDRMAERLRLILHDPSSPLRPLVHRPRIEELIQGGPRHQQIPWFGQLMGNAQLFAYLIQVDTWLRRYHVQLI